MIDTSMLKKIWVEDNPHSIFDQIVAGDGTRVHHYNPEGKQESTQWNKKGRERILKSSHTPENSFDSILASLLCGIADILLTYPLVITLYYSQEISST